MPKLAINGGKPVRSENFPAYNPIGLEEILAVEKVMKSGRLSQFLARWTLDKHINATDFNSEEYSCDFFGGEKVVEFEKKWKQIFNAKHSISVNSNTSGLLMAIGASNIIPGDEVIVPPITMSASAACVFGYFGIPVFGDVQPDIFTLDPESIKKKITSKTKAIVVVHLFGHPADMDPIMDIARNNNLIVIEDCAQAPMTEYKGKKVGTIGDIGVFSLNYHKHIHTGEGGIITTNNDMLAKRLFLIRNHGEMAADKFGINDYTNIWGGNYRLTEIQAAIGIEQLKKLPDLVEKRILNCNYLAEHLGNINGLNPPTVYDNCKHVFYVQGFLYDKNIIGVDRNKFIKAVAAELPLTNSRESVGKLIYSGGYEPLYLQKIYHQDNPNLPYNKFSTNGRVNYNQGICPIAEDLYYNKLLCNEYISPSLSKNDLNYIIEAFDKVIKFKKKLK